MSDITPTTGGVGSVRPHSASPAGPGPSAFGLTHAGLRRPSNEDAFLVAPDLGLAVVADGVASSGGGAIAAETVVRSMRDFFAQPMIQKLLAATQPDTVAHVSALLVAAVTRAHNDVREAAKTSGLARMGTTFAMVLFVAGHVFVVHAGDSRVHRLRRGKIEQITDDHTALNEWIAVNGPAPPRVVAQLENVIVRAVSTQMSAVRPEIWVEPAQPGDLFLLSTDGLTRVVEVDAIHDIVRAAPDLATAARRLIEAALTGGGPDNVTAALIRFEGG